MAEEKERKSRAGALVLGGMGGAVLGAIAALLMARPAKAAPPDEKLDYLLECLTALIPVLAEVAERQASLIELLEKWLAAQGITPGVEVTVLTPWRATEPEEIFSQEIRATGTFYTDKMVDWRQGKRIYFFVESTLNQPVQIQVIGNKTDTKDGATDIDIAYTCPANDNISVGPAWDHWCPYIGIKITVAAAPTAGILTISAVTQE